MEIFLSEGQFREIFDSHIKIETYSKSIDSLFNSSRVKNRINYKPYYQRNYVWDDTKASYFIESILLGTEIPPLIFFDEGVVTEVIDGRQRFETIKRFIENQFGLSKHGLTSLIDLSKATVESLRIQHPGIYEAFLDAKVRIIEFKLVNNPPSDPVLIDKIKKEIFGRYNSGITPLKTSEIDNAVYDSDGLSKFFKKKLKDDNAILKLVSGLFLRQNRDVENPDVESVLQFIRKSLVIYKFPIKKYAGGKSRKELINKFYQFLFSEIDDGGCERIFEDFESKVQIVRSIKEALESDGLKPTRLFHECILWGLNIATEEGKACSDVLKAESYEVIKACYESFISEFDLTDSHYAKETVGRYTRISEVFEKIFYVSFSAYIQTEKSIGQLITDVTSDKGTYKEELEKLESLRITKPDPSRNTIDDLIRNMHRNRFLIRPSYQRSEVINLTKSSAIIESMLLGIMLPAIFIYKRKDGISEVIDGQQRLLTILGYVGEKYLDENGKFAVSRNNKFKLRGIKILTDLNGRAFEEMPEDFRERILGFDLFVVEIEQRLNEHFDPVDLFIRLNDKPYPIRENSFEMWNSWVVKDVIESVKAVFSRFKSWFFIKSTEKDKLRDRMENEELITILAYFFYRKSSGYLLDSYLDIHQKGGRVNARIKKKMEITEVLVEVSRSEENKILFLQCIELVWEFSEKVRRILEADGAQDLKESLDKLMSSGASRRYYTRTLQDFYILWVAISDMDLTNNNLTLIKSDLEEMFASMKRSSDESADPEKSFKTFRTKIEQLANK